MSQNSKTVGKNAVGCEFICHVVLSELGSPPPRPSVGYNQEQIELKTKKLYRKKKEDVECGTCLFVATWVDLGFGV